MENIRNVVKLRGNIVSPPIFSHENHNRQFFTFPLRVQRLSGNEDTINIVADKQLLEQVDPNGGSCVAITGELRSFNNRSGQGSRLVITVYAFSIETDYGEHINHVEVTGAICKQPVFRTTPLGRDICDVMLAVNRRYRRTDYLPVIVWGRAARDVAYLPVGTELRVEGRIQSRTYIKMMDGVSTERTAFEISAIEVSVTDSF